MADKRYLLVLTRQFSGFDEESIGAGVSIVRLTEASRKIMAEQNAKQIANWDLYYSGYSHAFQNAYNPDEKTDEEAEQEIIRATIILKIIQPFSSGLHLVFTASGEPETPNFVGYSRVGIGSRTYVSVAEADSNLTPKQIAKSRYMWPQIQRVCLEWEKHRRILSAIRLFEIGCSNYDGRIRHILFHSALEALLCTSRDYSTQQVKQRVLALCPTGVSRADMRDITEMRGSIVHSGMISQSATGRAGELNEKLERILRVCLYHVLSTAESTNLFADEEEIKKHFPVEVEEKKSSPTGKRIFV